MSVLLQVDLSNRKVYDLSDSFVCLSIYLLLLGKNLK